MATSSFISQLPENLSVSLNWIDIFIQLDIEYLLHCCIIQTETLYKLTTDRGPYN